LLIILIAALLWPYHATAAEKKMKRQTAKPVASESVAAAMVNDANLHDSLRTAEDQIKKGRTDDALRILLAVYAYASDNLKFLACAGEAYEKARGDPDLAQEQKETLYLKQQRIGSLVARYSKVRGESAYDLGLAYSKKGDVGQARKYLTEACRTVPFSLNPASLWMKSKELFLKVSNLEGEF
jgi:tetratricopeptide (TPR) repeat protein